DDDLFFYFFFSSGRRHTRFSRDWSSDVCSSDLDMLSAATARCSRFGFFSQFKQRAVAALNMSLGGSGCVPEHPSERARAIWLEQIGRASCRERVEMT